MYSGVRYNGPAATAQFLAKDKTLLTWDLTPVIVIPVDLGNQEVLQAVIADNPDKMFPPSDVHLMPDIIENVWRLSTAQMEADTLRVLSRERPMKKSLSFCKVLSSRLKQWNDKVEFVDTSDVDVVPQLLIQLENMETCKRAQSNEELNRKMRFAHILIPSEKKVEYNEDGESNISINNAAKKHILFKAASKRKGAFGSQGNMDLVRELVQEVFETLGNEEVHGSEHAFVPGMRTSHLSVSPAMAYKKQALAQDVCR